MSTPTSPQMGGMIMRAPRGLQNGVSGVAAAEVAPDYGWMALRLRDDTASAKSIAFEVPED
jgi:hypothetical protein